MKPRCLKIETRKRARSPNAKPKSALPLSCSSRWQRSGVMLFISETVSSASSVFVSSFRIRPWSRKTGGWPTDDVDIAGALLDRCLQQFVNQNRRHINRPLRIEVILKSADSAAVGYRRRRWPTKALSFGRAKKRIFPAI